MMIFMCFLALWVPGAPLLAWLIYRREVPQAIYAPLHWTYDEERTP